MENDADEDGLGPLSSDIKFDVGRKQFSVYRGKFGDFLDKIGFETKEIRFGPYNQENHTPAHTQITQ